MKHGMTLWISLMISNNISTLDSGLWTLNIHVKESDELAYPSIPIGAIGNIMENLGNTIENIWVYVLLVACIFCCRHGCHHFPDSANTPFYKAHHTYSNMRFVTLGMSSNTKDLIVDSYRTHGRMQHQMNTCNHAYTFRITGYNIKTNCWELENSFMCTSLKNIR